jgi:hypothetical protein
MSTSDQSATAQAHDEFVSLWDRVIEARTVVDSQRRLPARNSSWSAQADLLYALEAYADCLTKHGRPIPYALRDELRLRRLTR